MVQIIPAIDLIDGRCVRLIQGDFSQKHSYADDPVDVALRFEDAGLKRLHLVDLDGAREGRVINYKILEKIAHRTGLAIDFSGGLATEKDVKIAFECGAKLITLGSVAVKDEPLAKRWLSQYGSDTVILAADVKDEEVVIDGWETKSKVYLFDLLGRYLDVGMKQVMCTDVSKDGMLQGPGFELYRRIRDEFPEVALIASGGVTTLKDIEELRSIGVSGIIVGKALFEGRILLRDLILFMKGI